MMAGALIGVVALVCSACGGASSTKSPPTSAPATTPVTTPVTTSTTSTGSTTTLVTAPPKPSSGCTESAAAAPGTVTLTPFIGGKERTAIVHLPAGYAPPTPVPLVVNMHGSQSTALQQEGLTDMDATADTDSFIVVYPQGDIPAGSGYEWNVPGQPLLGGRAVPAGSPNDVSFIEQLVSSLEQRYCIDMRRVFATGFSGGARMASQLGCDASTLFAAIAPVSGLRLPKPCLLTRTVPVVAFHGTADPVDPYLGHGQKYWTYGVPAAAKRWAKHDQCQKKGRTSQVAATVLLTRYAPCSAGSEVELYSIVGEGHEWPGGPHLPKRITDALGPQSTAISANNTMWSFFEAHPLP
jgi:polyhydroxybutyrate depolymerase